MLSLYIYIYSCETFTKNQCRKEFFKRNFFLFEHGSRKWKSLIFLSKSDIILYIRMKESCSIFSLLHFCLFCFRIRNEKTANGERREIFKTFDSFNIFSTRIFMPGIKMEKTENWHEKF